MQALINFFAFRPVFTLFGLRLVWYVYLINTLVQLYIGISGILQTLAQRGISWETWWPNFTPVALSAIAQLAIVRLLLEVAAVVISNSRTTTT